MHFVNSMFAFFWRPAETREMWSKMQWNYRWTDVLRETFVSQSVSQLVSKWGKNIHKRICTILSKRWKIIGKICSHILLMLVNSCILGLLTLFSHDLTTFKETTAAVLNKRQKSESYAPSFTSKSSSIFSYSCCCFFS